MKKLLSVLLIPVVTVVSMFGLTQAQFNTVNPYQQPSNDGGVVGVAVPGEGQGREDAFVNVVRWFINWTLGILAFIALIILLYGGFQMVTAAWNEDKYKTWFTILRQAAIGLILIGVAWFVISLIFRLVFTVSDNVQPAATWSQA